MAKNKKVRMKGLLHGDIEIEKIKLKDCKCQEGGCEAIRFQINIDDWIYCQTVPMKEFHKFLKAIREWDSNA